MKTTTYARLVVTSFVSAALVGTGAVAAPAAVETSPGSQDVVSQESIEDQMAQYLRVWQDAHPGEAIPAGATDFSVTPSDDGYGIDLPDRVKVQLVEDLTSSGFDHESVVEDGEVVTTYHVAQGVEIATTQPLVAPRISGGKDRHGVYVNLSPVEQDLILSGGGFALGVGICAIPVVGWGLCTSVGAVITVATVFLSNHKRCSGSTPKARIYPFNSAWNACVR
ncbi:hypothetical protein [Isoptericola sp. NPDC055881]